MERCPATALYVPLLAAGRRELQCRLGAGHEGDHRGWRGLILGGVSWRPEPPPAAEETSQPGVWVV